MTRGGRMQVVKEQVAVLGRASGIEHTALAAGQVAGPDRLGDVAKTIRRGIRNRIVQQGVGVDIIDRGSAGGDNLPDGCTQVGVVEASVGA